MDVPNGQQQVIELYRVRCPITAIEKLARMLLHHLERLPNYYRTKYPLSVVEAVNANIKSVVTSRPRLP